MTKPVPSYVTCPIDGGDHFTQARRLYTLPYEGGQLSRNWASGENASSDIVCTSCGSRLRWNDDSQSYVVVESGKNKLPPNSV